MIYRWLQDGHLLECPAEEQVFEQHYQLIVAGAGTAGSYAILAAAAMGVTVLGIDRNGGIGGMGTYGYVSGYYYGAAGGLHVAVDQEAEQLKDELFIDTVEAKRYLLEKKSLAAGARLLLEARLCGVYLEDSAVCGVSVLAEGRIRHYSCTVAIDATADGDLCRLVGCAMESGRQSDGKMRPFTSVQVWLTADGQIARTNHDSGYADQYDVRALSRAILQAHASQLLAEFRSDKGKILFLAPMIGIREGRRIMAEYQLTMPAILNGELAPDPLFYAYADFDKHGKDNALESEVLCDWYVACNLSTVCVAVPVPAASLIPRGCRSLIVAGRHLGVDHDTASLIRMKRDMHRCGESAGVLAALAIRQDVQPLDVPYADIKAHLMRSGCLDAAHAVGRRFDDRDRRCSVDLLSDPAEIRRELASERPGIALFSCQRSGDAIRPSLRAWLAAGDPLLAGNSAIALALLGDPASLPVLRRLIQHRDSFFFKDCRRTNQLRSAIAIYLVGKLGDIDSLPLLEEILCFEQEGEKALYRDIQETSYQFNPTKNFNAVYFQIVSHAAIAVLRISECHPDTEPRGRDILARAFGDDRHIRLTTTMPAGTYEYSQMDNIRAYVQRRIAG